MNKKGPLVGIRVIDFGQYIAGPLASMIFADYGADVIHIDPPGGPVWNEYHANAVLLRGKRNIVLNLKKGDDLEIAKKLISTADILIENFRPGVMMRLGLDKEVCRLLNPALIYCSIPGFSSCDPRADLRGWEGIVESEAGIYTDVMTDITRFNALPLASTFAAVMAVHSVVAALIVRERSGHAQSVEVPLYDACFEVEGVRGIDPPAKRNRQTEGNRVVPDYLLMKYLTQHPCKDGKYIQVTPPPRGTKNMVEMFIPSTWAYHAPLTEDEDKYLQDLMKTKTSIEWEITGQEDCQAGVVAAQTTEEWAKDPSAVNSRSVISVHDPILGDTMQPGVPSLMFLSGDSAGLSPRHKPDQDRSEILAELDNLTPPQYDPKGKITLPLDGYKVLDFCQVLAGPICGRLLSEYGAEVIKINNPRTYENPIAMAGHETVNNGKLTTYIDLKSEEGKYILDQLIRECDVFHCNFSQKVYDRLGVTEQQLRERNPNIILSQVNVHSLGGWRQWERGHEDLGEAVTGLSCRYGGGIKPENVPVLVCDNMTGQNATIGVLLAVYHRIRTGEGQRVQASLSRSATLAQIPYMLTYDGKIWDEPSGPDAKGWSIFNRIYRTKDGHIFLANASPSKMKEHPLFSSVNLTSSSAIETVLIDLSSSDALAALSEAGAEARIVRNFAKETMEEAYAKARGLSRRDYHVGMGEIRTTSCAPRLSLTPPRKGFACREAGGDTEYFLKQFYTTHKE